MKLPATVHEAGPWWLVAAAASVAGVIARLWQLGRKPLSFDEAFTATAARLPPGDLLARLRVDDAHPPLDYLLRGPLASGGPATLRSLSAALSVLTLAAAAWWLRRHGRLGAMAIIGLSASPFLLFVARDARMYAGMVLAGVVVAVATDRWLRDEPGPWSAMAAAALAAGLFLHGSGLLLAFGAFGVPGIRRDRAAWRWRASVAGAVATWLLLWGPSFLDQLEEQSASWIPLTTPGYLVRTLGNLVAAYPTLAAVIVVVVAGGFVALRQVDAVLFRTAVHLFALPAVATAVVGIWVPLLLPRTLAFAAWAPLTALAAAVELAWRRWTPLGAIAGAGLLLLLGSAVDEALLRREPHEPAVDAVAARARPGDVVAMWPGWLWPLATWEFGDDGEGAPTFDDGRGLRGTRVGGGPPTGRIWVVRSASYPTDFTGYDSCGRPVDQGEYWVHCLDPAGS